jgi:hypothetical protein
MDKSYDLELARQCRQRAADYRHLAAGAIDELMRESRMHISLTYDEMASRIEERAAHHASSAATIDAYRPRDRRDPRSASQPLPTEPWGSPA